MNIQTKFDMNNLVQHKFRTCTKQRAEVYEVLQIESATCYALTQVFYMCRPIIISSKNTFEKDKNGDYIYDTTVSDARANQNDSSLMGWVKFREDELIEASQELIEIVLSKGEIS